MKFLVKNKKLFALIALICFALTLVINLFSAGGDIIGSFKYMFEGFGQFLIAAVSIVVSLVSLLVPLSYTGAALFVWKKDSHMKLLAIAGVCLILGMFLSFVNQVISFITYEYFNFSVLVSQFFDNFLPFVFAAYLLAFSFLKVKGPVVPILGVVLVGLMLGSDLLGAVAAFVENIVRLFQYFHWDNVWYTITGLFGSGVELISSVGLLLLVPAAFYIPKDEEEAVAADAEEIPAE